MAVDRQQELANSLKAHFNAQTAGLEPIDRLRWLFEHLDEYLDRWIVFCSLDHISLEGFVKSDLHIMLLLAIDLIEQELASLADLDQFRERWREFAQNVRAIHAHSSKNAIDVLRRGFADANAALLSTLT